MSDLKADYAMLMLHGGSPECLCCKGVPQNTHVVCCQKQGKAMVLSVERETNMIEDLLQFKKSLDAILKTAFANSELLSRALSVCSSMRIKGSVGI